MASKKRVMNQRQTELRRIMMSFVQHQEAIERFLWQHAMLHSGEIVNGEFKTYADEILDKMSEEQIRRIPQNSDHSVAWCIWHIARIEDVTMNLLVAGSPQVLNSENWLERMKATIQHTGNTMDNGGVTRLSATIDIEALFAYRLSVGRRTREIVRPLGVEELKQKVEPLRLQRVIDEGAIVEAAMGLIDYWGRRNIAGLLLMPATRHNLVHLNEAQLLKRKRH